MFHFKFCAVIIVLVAYLVVGIKCADENTEFPRDVENLLNHFPQHIEEALNLEEDHEKQELNRTFPLLGQCSRDFRRIFTSLLRRKIWAFKVIDSWGKLPSGILSGNLYEFGDFDQCLSIDEPKEFVPQYCLARIGKDALLMPTTRMFEEKLKSVVNVLAGYGDYNPQERMVPTVENMLGMSFGICIPKSCTPEKVTRLFKTVQKWIFRNKIDISLVPDTCQVKEDLGWNLNGGDYACLVLLLALVASMVFSTIYDLIRTKQDKEKNVLLSAFSVYSNGKKLFDCKRSKNPNTMECLDGIRMFSALWVIYGHAHIMSFMGPTSNLAHLSDWSLDYSSLFVLSAFFAVDSFLFLSGFLATLSVLKTLTKTNGRINFLRNYVHRYLRLTPILAVIIIISLTLYKKVASGPVWYTFILNGIFCDKYWWSTLLYIQNYVNPDTICLSHTWYLSMDMQLFLFSPLFAYLFYRFGNYFIPVIIILVAISSGWTYWLYMHFDLINQFLNMTNDIQRTFSLTYFPTHVRMTPWLIGVGFGYFLFKTNGRKEQWSIIRVIFHWIVTTGLAVFIIFYSHLMQKMTHEGSPLESAIFTPLSRIGWTLFLCMLVYACLMGYGGPVNWFLSLPQWKPFARLSYAIYLIHMPIMMMEAASLHRPQYFSARTTLFKFFGDTFATTLLSIFATLALEYPMVIIESNIFSGKKKERVLPTTSHEIAARQQPSAPENT